MNKLNFYQKSSLICLLLFSVLKIQSQEVVQESTDWNKLRFQPGISFSFPMAIDLDNPVIPMGLNLDAYYELGNIADFKAGLQYGTFKGVSVGGTYHLSDKISSKMTRFIVAQTGRKVYFYKNMSEYRRVFGPTANLQIGNYSPTGFYARFDGGIDLQRHSRAYYDGYPSSRNGFSSIKLMATVVNLNQPEETSLGKQVTNRVGVGASAAYFAELKPWKRITFFGGMDMGYITLLGVEDHYTGYVTLRNTKWMIIGNLKAGISVSL